MVVTIIEVEEQTAAYADLLQLAGQLAQARYIPVQEAHIDESILLGAFVGQRCVGFLRLLIQVIGRDRGRPPLTHAGQLLREGYVEAFGVGPVPAARALVNGCKSARWPSASSGTAIRSARAARSRVTRTMPSN